jgi:phosphoribosylamine-glycine ligase
MIEGTAEMLEDIPDDLISQMIEAAQKLHRETARLRSDAQKLLVSIVGETNEPERDYTGPKIETAEDLLDMLNSCRKFIENSEYDIRAIRTFLTKNGRVLTSEEINQSLQQSRRLRDV